MRAKIKRIYRNSGKLSVMMLVFVILFTLTAPAAAATIPFRDVPQGEWFYNSVVWAYTDGITRGTSPTTFSPYRNVTRGQFVTFLYRIEGNPPIDNTPRFNDVSPSQYYFRAVNWASANGIVFGIGGGNFAPGRSITREEMAVILFRYALFVGADLTSSVSTFNSFPDRNTTSTWARPAMQWATHHGIIVGSNGRLLPRDDATRGQSVTILHRADRNGLLGGSLGADTFNYINPLTGLGSARNISANRPVAVSIGNTAGAMPTNATNGISQADIVYEFLVEHGDTRLLALYQDFTDVGLVGSIRSARPYTVDIADAYHALLIHAGATAPALENIIERNITNFDEVQGPRWGIFSRNPHRIPGHTVDFGHSVVTSGSEATRWFPAYRVRLIHRDNDNDFGLSFTENPIPTGGSRAHSVELRFSSHKTSTFTFNERQNRYHMSQFGSRFTDVNNNAPVAFTNLLILQMSVTPLEDPHDIPERLNIDTVGGGTGYFVSNGRWVSINWSRASESSPFVYTFDGGSSPIELGRGRTYIGIIPVNESVTFSP